MRRSALRRRPRTRSRPRSHGNTAAAAVLAAAISLVVAATFAVHGQHLAVMNLASGGRTPENRQRRIHAFEDIWTTSPKTLSARVSRDNDGLLSSGNASRRPIRHLEVNRLLVSSRQCMWRDAWTDVVAHRDTRRRRRSTVDTSAVRSLPTARRSAAYVRVASWELARGGVEGHAVGDAASVDDTHTPTDTMHVICKR